MSLKVKLISIISLFMLTLGILIIGVFAATQTINLKGNVNFDIEDTTLYVKDIRLQTELTGEPETIDNFMPGYTNQSFDLNLGTVSSTSGTVNIYFDFINTTSTAYTATATGGSGVTLSTSGVINGDAVSIINVSTYEDISGTITLTIKFTGGTSGNVDLDGITITLNEYNPTGVQVISAYSSGATTNTYADFAGNVAIDGVIDLSNIAFNTGETTLTISMSSLSSNYVKNIVSYSALADGLTVNSTSLYLPQNLDNSTTEQKQLKIYVVNNNAASTIPGLQVSFEEKESLLQTDISEYTGEGYWYVEMGTIARETENEYLRWRYFSDTETHYEYNADTPPTGTGYYILETYTDILDISWNNEYISPDYFYAYHQENGWGNIYANDYSTSSVRQYLNGEMVYKSFTGTYMQGVYPSGEMSSMYIDLNIDIDNDLIYNKIISRSLYDLYEYMGEDSAYPLDEPTFDLLFPDFTETDIVYTSEDADNFWLLSAFEVNYLLAVDGYYSGSNDLAWGGNSAYEDMSGDIGSSYYWLRTAYTVDCITAGIVESSTGIVH